MRREAPSVGASAMERRATRRAGLCRKRVGDCVTLASHIFIFHVGFAGCGYCTKPCLRVVGACCGVSLIKTRTNPVRGAHTITSFVD